jgi:beta-glucosidase
MRMTAIDSEIKVLISQLSLSQKIELLSGEDAWTTYAHQSIGLRKMTLSDGPSGVRGPKWDERFKSLTLPSATCTAATWSLDHLYSIGVLSAAEARSKGVDVVLGPTINLHRSPRGGRHFEAYSEDPVLSGQLAAAYIRGVQDNGVAATPKHYVANDSENDRMNVDVQLDQQTLHELYLAPFEIAVREAKAWAIMASYNKINGTTATEHELLSNPLRTEWGFDGVAMSDWTAVRSVRESANASLDLAMPGPDTPWSAGLQAAVEAGEVSIETIDAKVSNILTLAKRVGALGATAPKAVKKLDAREVIRQVAADGFVLVENKGVLPLKQGTRSVAVIGSHSIEGRIGGGGSATTIPHNPISPIRGLASHAPAGLSIKSTVGYHSVDELTDLPLEQIKSPSGERAIEITWIDKNGDTLLVEDRYAGRYIGMSEPVSDATKVIKGRTTFTANETGAHRFGIAGIGFIKIFVDGKIVLDVENPLVGSDILEALLAAPEKYVDVELQAGQVIELAYEYTKEFPFEFFAIGTFFGYRAPRLDAEIDMQLAVEAARTSDVAIVVVGTTSHVESEGFDRASLKLPGRQDELVNAVAAVNKNTVVVINAGSPVEMPWRNNVAAVILTWFPGEEYGNALADVIYGNREPGGRLPTTWGALLEDAPISSTDPVDGALKYSEGLNIGYRAWSSSNTKPAYPFGFGLGYTTWQLIEATHADSIIAGEDLAVEVALENTGNRAGSDVVQVYLRRKESGVNRPSFWLAGFQRVEVEAGATNRVSINISAKRFAHYFEDWNYELGEFEVIVSRSAALENALVSKITLN